MSKAEERALEEYPIESHEMYDDLYRQRIAYAKGYEQAEKDLELTWKDMEEIVEIANLLETEWLNSTPWDGIRDCEFYKEVLKRYKDNKERIEDDI